VVPVTKPDRILGCLLGGASGDAFGAQFEGRASMQVADVSRTLRITDDTQLTLATCEAIVHRGGSVDPEAIANRFLHWFRERRLTGLGSATLKALTELDAGGHWALVGASGEFSAGNGAATRIAPLAFLLDPDVDGDRQIIRDACRITHRNDEAYIGALAVIRAIRHLADGASFDSSSVSQIANKLPDSRLRDRLRIVADVPQSVTEYCTQYGASGYVVDSVPCAMVAAISAEPLSKKLHRIAECGGDTDSIASLCGQITGANNGQSALPHFLECVEDLPMIREIFERFAKCVLSNR
jgi:ADP-ribosylglycohydrolase